jgi:LmbE family N-acetylglucosaminyl deacetylase
MRLWLVGPWEDGEPALVQEFDSGAVLVLAPHPDDEIIGPGGTIARHVAAGAKVTPVILTDGRWGGPNEDGTLVEKRKAESRRAAEIIGSSAPIFLDAPDCELGNTPGMVDRLRELIGDTKAKYVYLPALTDGHPDHWATNCLVFAALATLAAGAKDALVLRGYEVWTPVLANCCVDITAQAELKRRAIDVFVTQTASHDYAEAALGLNRYRSLQHLFGRGYAEAFMQMSAAEFTQAFKAASLRHGRGADAVRE